MVSSTLLAALVGVAASQVAPETTIEGNGDFRIERRQQISVASLSETVAAQGAQIAMLSPVGEWTTTVEQRITATATTVNGLESQMSSTVSSLQASLSSAEARIDSLLADNSRAAAVASESRAATAAAAAQEASDALDARISTLTASVSTSVAALTRSVSTTTTALGTNMTRLTAALDGKKDAVHKIWAGGCSTYPGGGWHWYCLNRQTYYTAAGYFRKQDNYIMRAQRANMFVKLTMWTITHGSGWNRMTMHVNNGAGWAEIMHSLEHSAGCWWKDMHGNLDFKVLNTNYQWRVRMHGACSHAFHPGGAERGGSGYHSRISSTYMGDIE
jgi:hypothetical protein